MYCSHCGKQSSGANPFCSHCGQRLTGSVQPGAATQPELLLRSDSNLERLENWGKLNAALLLVPAGIFVMLLLFVLPGVVESGEFSPALFVLLGLLFICNLIALPKMGKIRDQLSWYAPLAKAETLIVDAQKVYGTTDKGEVKLFYSQIKSVECKIDQRGDFSYPAWRYDMLVLKDTDDNTVRFMSFDNAKELAAIIQSNLNGGRNSHA